MAFGHVKTWSRSDEQRQQVLSLLRRFGSSANSFQVLQDQFEYRFCGPNACVAYVDTGAAWIAAGAPIADASSYQRVASEFIGEAHKLGRRVAFFGTETQFVTGSRLRSILVGSQPSFTASDWANRVRGGRELRRQMRRAQAKGLYVERLSISNSRHDEFMDSKSEPQRLIEQWLETKVLPQMGFLTRVQPFAFAAERRYFAARVAHRLVGVAVMVPIYRSRGWLIENLMRAPDAPNGTSETLVDAGVMSTIDEGDEFVTLGLTPLAGDICAWLSAAKRLGTPFYNFVGLERFRSKFQPSVWSPVYVSFPGTQAAPVAIYDCLVAFAHGSLFRFATQCGTRWFHALRDDRWRLTQSSRAADWVTAVSR